MAAGGSVEARHDTPRCLSCGTITSWRVEPLFLPRHWAIGCLFLVFFGGGLIYLLVVGLMRAGTGSRAKICPHCGARNMWTFMY